MRFDVSQINANIQSLFALYRQLKASGESGGAAGVYTPNAVSTLAPAGFTPGTGGSIVATAVVTPTTTGRLIANFTLGIAASAVDTPVLTMYYVNDVTAVTGGTVISGTPLNGIVGDPTNTTPAATSGTVVMSLGGTTSVVHSVNSLSVSFAGVPILGVVGSPTLIAIVGSSNSGSTTWTVSGTVNVSERA